MACNARQREAHLFWFVYEDEGKTVRATLQPRQPGGGEPVIVPPDS
ncbi:hypothetical protein [Streptomyces albogriseolus]